MYIIVGLGNPGEEYARTRHNTGRMAVDYISNSGKINAKFIVSDTFMNKSGVAVAEFLKKSRRKVGTPTATSGLIVIYDDLDLGLGTMKISYNRSSGGHRGLESIIRALKTEEFIRIRIGISPTTPSGKIKKPKGEREVEKHILGQFKKSETDILKKVFKRVQGAVEAITDRGVGPAMTEFNR